MDERMHEFCRLAMPTVCGPVGRAKARTPAADALLLACTEHHTSLSIRRHVRSTTKPAGSVQRAQTSATCAGLQLVARKLSWP
eukprot:350185-Chlamydomonas_euryale.AAC.1